MFSTARQPYRNRGTTVRLRIQCLKAPLERTVLFCQFATTAVNKYPPPPIFCIIVCLNVIIPTPPPSYSQTPTLAATTPATTSCPTATGREIARKTRSYGSRTRTAAASTKAGSGATSSLAVPTWLWLPTVRSITKQAAPNCTPFDITCTSAVPLRLSKKGLF